MKKCTKNEKNEKIKIKKKQRTVGKNEKKEKRAQRGYHPTVKRNRNETDAPKKSDFEHPTKKVKENERK